MRHVKVSRQLFQEPLQYAYWDRRRQLDAIRCNIASRMQWKFKFVVSLCCCPTWWWGSSSSRAHQACRGVKRHEKSDELSKQHKKSILLSRSIDFIGGQRTKHEHIFHTQNTNRLLLASPERDFNENQCFFSPAICISLWRILIEWTTRFYFFFCLLPRQPQTLKRARKASAEMWNSRAKQQQLFEMHLIRILIRPKQAKLSFAMVLEKSSNLMIFKYQRKL